MAELSNVQFKNGSTWTKINPFPVGFVYMSWQNVSPATLYGGTWTKITDDRFFKATSATSGLTGGSATHTHVFGISYVEHYGGLAMFSEGPVDFFHFLGSDGSTWGQASLSQQGQISNARVNVSFKNSLAINEQASTHVRATTEIPTSSNLPPYYNVYCWRRTA